MIHLSKKWIGNLFINLPCGLKYRFRVFWRTRIVKDFQNSRAWSAHAISRLPGTNAPGLTKTRRPGSKLLGVFLSANFALRAKEEDFASRYYVEGILLKYAEMILPKVPIVISTLFCLSGVISAACPKSSYTASQGTVLSPGFSTSESYGDDLSCTYNIIVPVGHRITLEFITLSILGTMPNCTEDSLEIFVG